VNIKGSGNPGVSVIDTSTLMVPATVQFEQESHPGAFGQFIGPAIPPTPLPTVLLTLTGCTRCRAGDRFAVAARVANPASTEVLIEAKIGVRLPGGIPINLFGKHLEVALPGSLDTTVTLLNIVLPPGLPMGAWAVEGSLLEPELGVTLSRSIAPFEVIQ